MSEENYVIEATVELPYKLSLEEQGRAYGLFDRILEKFTLKHNNFVDFEEIETASRTSLEYQWDPDQGQSYVHFTLELQESTLEDQQELEEMESFLERKAERLEDVIYRRDDEDEGGDKVSTELTPEERLERAEEVNSAIMRTKEAIEE